MVAHQAAVSYQKAAGNAVAPVFRLRDFLDTQAYHAYLVAADQAFLDSCSTPGSSKPSSVLVSLNPPVHGAFRSLLQGDHAGVEFACSGHEGLLRSAGVLGDPPAGRLLSRRCPVAVQGPWTGLIIDDLFCISAERLNQNSGFGPEVSQSERLVLKAKEAYAAEGVEGSDSKDQFSRRLFNVAGAQIDATDQTVKAGCVLVGLPAPRRLALSHASLAVAAGRFISEELASILCGCWVSRTVGCSDASLARGAVCITQVDQAVAEHLWQTAGQKGWYARLETEHLRGHTHDKDDEASSCDGGLEPQPGPARPLALDYDFLEVRSGGPWASELLRPSFAVGPVIDAAASPYFRIADCRCLEWVLYLLQARKLRAILVAPPVLSFSPAARRPGLGSPRKRAGDLRILAAALAILLVAGRCDVPAVLFHPALTRARALPSWQRLVSLHGYCELFFGGCDLFSEGRGAVVGLLSPAASGPSSAFRAVDPTRTPASAVVVADCFGQFFPAPGLEGLLLNDLMVSHTWHVESSWAWRDASHINILEGRSYVQALRARALGCDDLRFVHGLDSSVALGAFLKGRTSSRLLLPVVKQAAAIQVSFGLYPGPVFCPTRLNVSDAPARLRQLPEPVPGCLASSFGLEDLFAFSALGGLSRPSCASPCSDGPSLLKALVLRFRDIGFRPAAGPSPKDPALPNLFDSTLGYPGEGPPGPASQGPFLVPRDARDLSRARAREGAVLPVNERTSKNRAFLLGLFAQWLASCDILFEDLLDSRKADAETVNLWLVSYGRQLFESGRPYWHYSETINGLAARKPILKRSLQAACDLAFSWMALEPTTHHVAMPAVILLGMLTTCLLWGWVKEAGLFALSWGGLLRIGEATSMVRENLVLPRDVLFSQLHILARIEEPKTRMRMARHQAARVEQSDLVQLISLAFGGLAPQCKLWPQSSQTLRRRFDLVLERLGISTTRSKHRPLDLGSFRPGGATHLLSATENSEFVRRRGRWASHRVMEIYIQEVTACTFFPSLPLEVRQRVLTTAQAFTATLEQALEWDHLGVPAASWYSLFSAG